MDDQSPKKLQLIFIRSNISRYLHLQDNFKNKKNTYNFISNIIKDSSKKPKIYIIISKAYCLNITTWKNAEGSIQLVTDNLG